MTTTESFIAENPSPAPRAETGIEGLDVVLGGGLPRNRLFLVEGQPGAGKTTFGLQFLRCGHDAGERTLYISLTESQEELQEIAASHGWSLEGINLYHHRSPPMGEEDLSQTVFHPAEVELRETMSTLLEEVERIDPRRVVFDSLSELRLVAHDGLRYRRQLLTLKHYFSGRQRTAVLLDDLRPDDSDAHLQSIAGGVMRLEEMVPEFGGNRRRLRVMKIRASNFRSGYHDYKIMKGGLKVFPRLIAAEHHRPVEEDMMSSGIKPLDEMLGGGLDRGTSTLIMGPAGTGKSTLSLQYAVAAARRGEKVAVFVFDETAHVLMKRARGLGLDCEPFAEQGTLSFTHVDPAELSPGEFVHAVSEAAETGVKLVIIDSLNGYFNAMTQERLIALHVHELLTYLSNQGICTIMVGAQRGLIHTADLPAVEISYLADTVVLLRYFEMSGEMRKVISVFKRRGGLHDRTLREMRLVPNEGISIGLPLTGYRGVLTGTPIRDDDAVEGDLIERRS